MTEDDDHSASQVFSWEPTIYLGGNLCQDTLICFHPAEHAEVSTWERPTNCAKPGAEWFKELPVAEMNVLLYFPFWF